MGKIRADDYGDILALKCDGEKIFFSEKGGSYQGSYVAVIKTEIAVPEYSDNKVDQFYVFIGDYGSCSGCDWLEAEAEYDDAYEHHEVEAAKALEYAQQSTPIYILTEQPTQEWVDKLAERVNS